MPERFIWRGQQGGQKGGHFRGIIAAESEITETLGANRLIHPHHPVSICFLSSTSCDDFGTRFWSDVQWGTAHEQFRFVSFWWGNDWNGTLFPAPESGNGYKFVGLFFVLQEIDEQNVSIIFENALDIGLLQYVQLSVIWPRGQKNVIRSSNWNQQHGKNYVQDLSALMFVIANLNEYNDRQHKVCEILVKSMLSIFISTTFSFQLDEDFWNDNTNEECRNLNYMSRVFEINSKWWHFYNCKFFNFALFSNKQHHLDEKNGSCSVQCLSHFLMTCYFCVLCSKDKHKFKCLFYVCVRVFFNTKVHFLHQFWYGQTLTPQRNCLNGITHCPSRKSSLKIM